jgi:hypothetical protein
VSEASLDEPSRMPWERETHDEDPTSSIGELRGGRYMPLVLYYALSLRELMEERRA